MRPSFFHHLHPPTIPARQSRWRYTLGAGGTAVFLALVVGATGILEMFYYIPTLDQAALSIQTISYLVPFGGLVRNLHYWSAQLFLVMTAVHLVRVVFTGAYAPPRRFNYLLGLALLVAAILLDFTGYILRWDQGIQWALVVGTNLVKTIPWLGSALYVILTGGTDLGASTLIRFYSWHIFALTLGFVVLTVWHIFHVRRDGGIAVPPASTSHRPSAHLAPRTRPPRGPCSVADEPLPCCSFQRSGQRRLLHPSPNISAVSPDASAPWFFLWIQ